MAAPIRDGDPNSEGEFLSIRERIVVATSWGRVYERDVSEGARVEAGTLLGQLRENGETIPVVAPLRAVFVRWLVREGERVAPGSRLALLLSVDGEE
jgi:biotin carboxyl carrier protein